MDNLSTTIALVDRVVLAAVFLTSGFTKLGSRQRFRQDLSAFGVPNRAAALIAPLLPCVELIVALLLLTPYLSWWAALCALTLLLIFTAAIAINLARHQRPSCNCFGALSRHPIGGGTVVRNVILIVMASVPLFASQSTAMPVWAAVKTMSIKAAVVIGIIIALTAIIVFESVLLVVIMKRYGRLLSQAHGPVQEANSHAMRSRAPLDLSRRLLSDLSGRRIRLADLVGHGTPSIIVFVDPQCSQCDITLSDVQDWWQAGRRNPDLVLISRGPALQARRLAAKHDIDSLYLDSDDQIVHEFNVRGTPSAVLLGASDLNVIAFAQGVERIRNLLADLTRPSEDSLPEALCNSDSRVIE
jgi:uncharacterized membrane protein YphA (DoxX/SURF4 family)